MGDVEQKCEHMLQRRGASRLCHTVITAVVQSRTVALWIPRLEGLATHKIINSTIENTPEKTTSAGWAISNDLLQCMGVGKQAAVAAALPSALPQCTLTDTGAAYAAYAQQD